MTLNETRTCIIVHGPDRVTVHPPPLGQSETKFLLFLGPLPISKVDAIKKKLGWTTCFGPFSKWPPSKSGNHVLCHNLSSKAVRVTKLVSMHIFLGVRNSIMLIKNVSVLWTIYKPLFKRIFRTFLVNFCVSLWDRKGYCAPSTHESLRPIFLAHKTSPISIADAIKYKSDGLPILGHFKMAANEIWKSRFVP